MIDDIANEIEYSLLNVSYTTLYVFAVPGNDHFIGRKVIHFN